MDRLRAAWTRSAPYVVPAAIFLAVILVVFWRLWTPLGERRSFAWDAKYEYWGDLQFQLRALAHGHLPLWNPHDRLGYPFYADPQAGTLYPLQWPLWGLAALVGPAWWLIVVKILLHLELGALGMYALCAQRGLPSPARYLGGLVFLLSYPILHNAPSALDWGYAWTPWLLAAISACAKRPDARHGALLALATAMMILAGAPAAAFYGGMVAVPWTIVEIVCETRRATERGDYLRALARTLGLAGVLVAAIVGAQVIATSSYLEHTVRAHRDAAFYGASVLSPSDVLGFFVPRMRGEHTYVGLAPLFWAAAMLVARPTARTLALAAVVVLGVLCAFGDRTPVLPLLASVLPPFGMFRRAHRYLYVAVVPLALLAAEGLAWCATITDEALRARIRRGLTIAGAIAVIACTLGFAVRARLPWHPDDVRDAFGFGVASAQAAAWTSWMLLRRRPERRHLVLAVAIVGIDLWFAAWPTIDKPDTLQPPPALHHDDLVAHLPRDARIYDRDLLTCRPGTRLGLRDFGGYDLDPLALTRYEHLHAAVERSPGVMAYAGVSHYFEGSEHEDDPLAKSPADLSMMTEVAPGQWDIAAPAPMVAWYDTAAVATGPDAALARLLVDRPGARAVLESAQLDAAERARVTRVDVPAAPTVTGSLDALSDDSLVATVDAPADGIVVIAEMFYERGWTATVDSAPVRILAAQSFARAVLVGPGHHVIAMRFADQGYELRVVLELVGLAAAIALLVLRSRRP